MDQNTPSGLAPEQARALMSQQQRIDLQVQGLRLAQVLARPSAFPNAGQQPIPFPPTQAVLRPAPRAPMPSPYPRLTKTNLLIAAGLTYASAEARLAYDSFTDEEKVKAGKIKFALLVTLRTGKNILSRPVQLITLPCKLFGYGNNEI